MSVSVHTLLPTPQKVPNVEVILQLLEDTVQDADDPEAFVILSVVFVSNLQAAKAFQPGECAFDSPADAVVTSIPQGQRTGDLLIHAAAIGSNQTNVFEQQCCALSIGTCQSLLEFHGVCFWVSHG